MSASLLQTRIVDKLDVILQQIDTMNKFGKNIPLIHIDMLKANVRTLYEQICELERLQYQAPAKSYYDRALGGRAQQDAENTQALNNAGKAISSMLDEITEEVHHKIESRQSDTLAEALAQDPVEIHTDMFTRVEEELKQSLNETPELLHPATTEVAEISNPLADLLPIEALSAAVETVNPTMETMNPTVEAINLTDEPLSAAMETVNSAMKPLSAATETLSPAVEAVSPAVEPVAAVVEAETPAATEVPFLGDFAESREEPLKAAAAAVAAVPVPDIFSSLQTIADMYRDSGPSLNDNMMQKNGIKTATKQIRDLKSSIGINEKFLFINELFRGNMKDYTDTILSLNETQSLDDAMQILGPLRMKHQWQETGTAYQTLCDFLQRRFA